MSSDPASRVTEMSGVRAFLRLGRGRRDWFQSPMVLGVGWILGAQIIGLGTGLGTSAALARSLGPEGQGLFAVTMLIPTFLALVAGGGLSAANVYFAGGRTIAVPRLISNSATIAIVGTTLSTAALIALASVGGLEIILPGVTPIFAAIGLILLPILLIRQSISAILLGLQRIGRSSRMDMVQSASYLVAVLLLVVALQGGVSAALIAYGASLLIALALGSRSLGERAVDFLPRTDARTLRSTLGYGLRGSVGAILQFFTYRLDLVLVNIILSAAAAGQYAIASRLAELLWLLPAAVGAVIFSRSSASGAASMNEIGPRAFWATLFAGAGAAVLMAVTGPVLIPLIYTSAFSASYGPMVVLLPGAVVLGSSAVLANDLAGRNHPGLISIGALAGFIATLGLDLLLIPVFGTIGAAAASTLAYSTYALVVLVIYLRVTGLSLLGFARSARPWTWFGATG